MGNILAFNASGRTNSVGSRLSYLAGCVAADNGHYVEQIHPADGLEGCSGCGWCNTHDGCTADDEIFSRLRDCHAVIFTAPIYFCGIAGQAKVLLDRLYAMMDKDFVPRHPGKKVLTIFTQGDPREELFRRTIEQTNHVFRMCGWEVVDTIVVAGITRGEYVIPEEIMVRVEEAAAKL